MTRSGLLKASGHRNGVIADPFAMSLMRDGLYLFNGKAARGTPARAMHVAQA